MLGVVQSRRSTGARRQARSRVIGTHKVSYEASVSGRYRVFNSAVYRFYRSNSAPPVEGDTPFATNATLPHEPADAFADGTWYLSVSRFNGVYDSGFLPVGPSGERYLRIDLSGGAEVTSPPAGPLAWHTENVGGGVVRIVATYAQSDSLRAGDWAIAYTTDGSTPPEDTPDITQTMPTSGLAVLSYDLPAQANGTTVKVRLQTRRYDSSYVYSDDSTIETITADAAGPSVVQAFTGSGD